jgi:hypothetical protein
MRRLALIVLTLAIPALAAPPPNETDYPTQYAVMVASKLGGMMIGKFCTMALRDQSVAFTVQKKGGGCHAWDAGTIIHGRREKNSIQLLVKDDNKGELKVEDWPIISTADLTPPPPPAQ